MDILVIDIGGTSVKLWHTGHEEHRKFESGKWLTPDDMVKETLKTVEDWKFEAVALGLPCRVSNGKVVEDPVNLGPGWVSYHFSAALGQPVRILNDACLQALGSYDGGRMLFLGLGTGVGSVLIIDHTVVPLELGELAYKPGHTFSMRLGRQALEDKGKKRWRKRVLEVVPSLQRAFMADYVVLGGGNSKHLREPLPPNVRLGHNLTAFRGGYRLWGIEDMPTHDVNGSKGPGPQAMAEWRLV